MAAATPVSGAGTGLGVDPLCNANTASFSSIRSGNSSTGIARCAAWPRFIAIHTCERKNAAVVATVVGVPPFGGEGLSGTDPKAGGPRYLHRCATVSVLTVDTTAAGGNASLFAMTEDEGA